MEKLLRLPGLHTDEVQAIDDALWALVLISEGEDVYEGGWPSFLLTHT
jgi:hypothetical protein